MRRDMREMDAKKRKMIKTARKRPWFTAGLYEVGEPKAKAFAVGCVFLQKEGGKSEVVDVCGEVGEKGGKSRGGG